MSQFIRPGGGDSGVDVESKRKSGAGKMTTLEVKINELHNVDKIKRNYFRRSEGSGVTWGEKSRKEERGGGRGRKKEGQGFLVRYHGSFLCCLGVHLTLRPGPGPGEVVSERG